MLNKVTIIGNLGADPEIRTTQDGREIATLNVATSEYWKDKNTGEKKGKTEWHKVVVFSEGLVRVLKGYTKKGSKVYLEGQLQTRDWQDKDSNKRYTTEIVLQGFNSKLLLLDNKGDGFNQDSGNENYNQELNNEIPF